MTPDELLVEPPSGVHPMGARQRARRIVIVGHGMVGQRLCEEIRARSNLANHRVAIFGDDPGGAYDRVHLNRIIRGEPERSLQLVPDYWYDENRVAAVRSERVVSLDREARVVRTESGRAQGYDHLILATGSAPVLAKIPGIDGPLVRPLRSAEDARTILELALGAREAGLPVVILGAGLLGLELADELAARGVATRCLESADYPLSRQLERSAGSLLAARLQEGGLRIEAGVRVTALVPRTNGVLVCWEGGEPILAGLVVPAMGVRPRDQLARDAGLRCDLFGGVEVDDQLLTSDPHISAVGECARHRGMTYGLVAPGYAMAETVARRLAGHEVKFEGVQVGTRLKVSQVELTVVGESAATGFGLRTHIYQSGSEYRRLVLRRGRVIGITTVGQWAELPRVQEAMARAEKLKGRQVSRFERAEPMWKRAKLSLETWPDSATVCTCMGVTCGALKRARHEGCANVEALCDTTGAGGVCGTCRPLLATLVEPQTEAPEEDAPWFLAMSLLSLVGALCFVFLPAIPYATSVQEVGIDVLWRSKDYKQITGFFLAFLFATSGVFSMRKRIGVFSWASFEAWRLAHAVVGVLCLVGGFAHTGFRLGSQLDFALALVFLGSVFLGGVAGGWGLLEDRLAPDKARGLRAVLIRSHIYLLWPLPVLLAAHVAKVYFF